MTGPLLESRILPGLYREVGSGRVVDVIQVTQAPFGFGIAPDSGVVSSSPPSDPGHAASDPKKRVEFRDVETGAMEMLSFAEFAKVGRFARISS